MIVKHPERGTVEFVLDLDTADTPHLMGSWDGWARTGIAMVRDGNGKGIWRLSLKLPPGAYQFRYRVGDQWFNDPAAECYVSNGLGSENGVVTMGKTRRVAGAPKTSSRQGRRREL